MELWTTQAHNPGYGPALHTLGLEIMCGMLVLFWSIPSTINEIYLEGSFAALPLCFAYFSLSFLYKSIN